MAKRDIKWTQQQARAIEARGSDVLVSASAGTGKTAVLTGRCIDIISDTTLKADVLNMLVVTFTNAAAEQMRTRIAEYLSSAYSQSNEPHLRRQLLLLGGADISTIHSFCKKIITEYFFELDLDPTFKVLESDEQTLLKADALQKCIDWAWNQDNLAQQMQKLLQKRRLDSAGFLSQIIDLSDYLDTVISRENWYERAEKIASAAEPLSSRLGQKQIDIVKDTLQKILNQFQFAQRLYEGTSTDGNWSKRWQENFVDRIKYCLELLNTDNWQGCTELILNYKRPSNLYYKPPDADDRTAPIIKDLAEGAVKSFVALCDLALFNPSYLDRLGPAVQKQTLLLIELVRRFEFFYSQAKRKIGCLDFADLEHLALKLLTAPESAEDDLKASKAAHSLRQRYKYIFVDEYQDINPVQKAILDMLKGKDNLFVVGDVKQSIYAFRGAQPAIFNKQLKSASDEPQHRPEKLRVDLNNNWRSKQSILDFVNKVFSRIMTSSLSGVDYDQRAALKAAQADEPKASTEQTPQPVVELHILEKPDGYSNTETITETNSEQDSSAISQRQRQAAAIAKRIRKMVGLDSGQPEFQIYDKKLDGFRGVEFRDIAILMRSPAERAADYAELLQLASIPVVCDLTSARHEATEINDFLSLLKVLDNPCRDIELAAVLRSPIFKITDTQFAQIKLYGSAQQRDGFYNCILKYSVDGPNKQLAGRLETIIETLNRWRDLARQGGIAELLWQIYRQSSYLSFVSALPNGRLRRANLLSLHEKAIEFEHFVSAGPTASVARFIEFIEKLQDTNRQWSPASATPQEENAVRLLSVHKSKGLEFSVVFVAELESRFSSKDFTSDCLIDSDGTLGLRVIDTASNTKLDSLAYQIIEHQRKKLLLAEEMRILYVAMTRAAERLVLVGSQSAKKCQSILSKAFYLDGESVPDFELADCSSHLEWILYGLGKDRSLHCAFGTDLADSCSNLVAFDLKVYDGNLLNTLCDYVVGLKNKKSPEFAQRPKEEKSKRKTSKLLSDIKGSINFKYPFDEFSAIAAKQSVTEITHREDQFAQLDYSMALQRKPQTLIEAESDLLQTPASRILGTATHLVISRLDLSKHVDKKAVKDTIDSLVEISAVTKSTAQNINIESIVKFFESDMGQAALDSENTVYREWPFTFALPAFEFTNSGHEPLHRTPDGGDMIIIQGIIDMLIKTSNGLIVIDFKTDRITADEVPQRAELYKPQLDYYAQAASAILDEKLLAKYLYFLTLSQEFKV